MVDNKLPGQSRLQSWVPSGQGEPRYGRSKFESNKNKIDSRTGFTCSSLEARNILRFGHSTMALNYTKSTYTILLLLKHRSEQMKRERERKGERERERERECVE